MKAIKVRFTDMADGKSTGEGTAILRILQKHYCVEISDNPDYIFYSCYGYDFVKYNCIRIYIGVVAFK